MKQLKSYISIRKGKSNFKATNKTIKKIVKDELDRLGHDADLNHIDVSEVTLMGSLFSCYKNDLGEKYKDLNPDISKWEVGNVKYMGHMFYDCKNFNQYISNWDVSKVENMTCMFWGCENFNQDISSWDVSNVKYYIYSVFENCPIKEEYKPKFNI